MTEVLCNGTLEQMLEKAGSTYQPVTPEERGRVVAAFAAFASGVAATGENAEMVRIIAGHINITYGLRHLTTGATFIVQRMNTIFDIDAIDNNLQLLEQAQELSAEVLPAHWQPVGYLNVQWKDSGKIYYDAESAGWRVMRYVPGDIRIFNNFGMVPSDMQEQVAYSLGEAIAVFGRMLDAIPEDHWREPLRNFHNAPYHLEYLDAILRGQTVRLSLCRDASRMVTAYPDFLQQHAGRIAQLREKVDRRRGLTTCLDALGHGVTHGDTKINNFIFRRDDEGQLRCVCLIDLDTVQVGNRLDDLGDALRSAGTPAGEEPPHIDDVCIDSVIVQGIIEGYVGCVNAFYGAARAQELRAHAIDAYKIFLYSQCLRFFADALVGNEYFKLKPGLPEDINLYRAEVQMRALEALEEMG
ncbi:MAG: phosphotransferase [Armatimonadota bacterium]